MFGFQSQRPVSSPQTVVSIVVDTGCHRTQRGRRRRDGNFYQINRGVSVPSTRRRPDIVGSPWRPQARAGRYASGLLACLVQPRKRAQSLIGKGDDFEQIAHAVRPGRGEPGKTSLDFGGARRARCPEARGSFVDTKPHQESPLGERPPNARTGACGRAPKRGEINMRGQVDLARALQHIGMTMSADGLERVA